MTPTEVQRIAREVLVEHALAAAGAGNKVVYDVRTQRHLTGLIEARLGPVRGQLTPLPLDDSRAFKWDWRPDGAFGGQACKI